MESNKIRTVIVDDELNCIEVLEYLLNKHCPEVQIVSAFQSPVEAEVQIRILKPNLIFMDIEMPVMNGFALLEKLKDLNFDIIFTTAYDDFAIRAFKVSAVDYLLKPVDAGELKEAVNKVTRTRKRDDNTLDVLLNYLQAQNNHNKIGIASDQGITFIDLDTLLYCKSDGPYTHFFMNNGKSILSSKSLGEYENQMNNKGFFRVHKSYLINMKHISKFVREDGGYVVMSDNTQIIVSRRRKEDLLHLMSGQ